MAVLPWNWQEPNWPRFTWDADALPEYEAEFLQESGMTAGAVKHLFDGDQEALAVEVMTGGALDTSMMEGEYLDRASVQSSIRRQFGLKTDRAKEKPAEKGIAEMLVDALRTRHKPLGRATLFRWHGMIAGHRTDLDDIGRYRTHPEPMRIVSGISRRKRRVHFEAPPSGRVEAEMRRFVRWFNASAPGGGAALPLLARAGITHLWFESIHPFEDGNGRIGRVLAEKAMMQGLAGPNLTMLSPVLLKRKKEYYATLERASRGLEITEWLVWFAGAAVESGRRTLAEIEFLIAKTKLLDRMRGRINPRQEKAILRLFSAGIEGFKGGLSAGNYVSVTGAAPATATRDLADLVEKGALLREGELKGARYRLNIPESEFALSCRHITSSSRRPACW